MAARRNPRPPAPPEPPRRGSSRWDDPWRTFTASKPLPVEGGIASSKARGAMAESWWSKRFVDALESYGLGGRMTRGRTYARKGQVLSLDVTGGLLIAQVLGSRQVPYAVTVRLSAPTATQWRKIEDALRTRVGYAARLLAGEVPTDLEAVFTDAGAALFPSQWREMRATCSCPDWGDPCKHQAAVLYVFADKLDTDPWLLLQWHGRTREDVVGLVGAAAASGGGDEIAPWWPLRPGGRLGDGREGGTARMPVAGLRDDPAAVLTRLGAFDIELNGRPLREILLRAYEPSEE